MLKRRIYAAGKIRAFIRRGKDNQRDGKLKNSGKNKSVRFIPEPKKIIMNLAGAFILAFGMYNIHSVSGVTEGGVLGLTLLLDYHFGLSPAVTGFILTAACYIIGWRALGKSFVFYSAFACGGFSLFYFLCEQFPPVYPGIAQYPAAAAVIGALFVGIGVGLCVRAEGAPSGDDALAMSLSGITGVKIQYVYLISDLAVLLLSLTYIPLLRIIWSLVTVVLSGQVIGLVAGKQK